MPNLPLVICVLSGVRRKSGAAEAECPVSFMYPAFNIPSTRIALLESPHCLLVGSDIMRHTSLQKIVQILCWLCAFSIQTSSVESVIYKREKNAHH